MKAQLLVRERVPLDYRRFVDVVIWRLPQAVVGSRHIYKYRLAYVLDGICVLRYDNEAGKGDHRHAAGVEGVYRFVSVDRLVDDFWSDVAMWKE